MSRICHENRRQLGLPTFSKNKKSDSHLLLVLTLYQYFAMPPHVAEIADSPMATAT